MSTVEAGTQILPDSLVAIVTVTRGDVVRRIAVPAAEPEAGTGPQMGAPTEIPVQSDVLLSRRSTERLAPVLEALAHGRAPDLTPPG